MKRLSQALLEEVPLPGSGSVAVREFDLPAFVHPWHRHPEVELTWILEGEGLRHVGDSVEPFRAGDFCLIGPHLPHAWLSSRKTDKGGRARSLVLQFDPARFGEPFWRLPDCARIGRLLARAAHGLAFRASLGARLAKRIREAEAPVPRLAALLEVLDELARTPGTRSLSLTAYTREDRGVADPKLRRVLAHLSEHAGESIAHSELARLVGLSPSAFSRFFRRAVGKTFQAYLTDLRLGLACRLLVETERSVSEIAYDVGFGNLSNFNRAFRQSRGMAPRDFRKQSLPR